MHISNNTDIPTAVIEEYVKDFKESTGGLPYYVMVDKFWFGRVINILFISKYEEEYDMSYVDENFEIFAATYNLDMDGYLEYGYITISAASGELYRKG